MQTTITVPYTRKALESLQRILEVHRALIWIDPTTNSLAVKRINCADEDERRLAPPSAGRAYV